MEDINNKAYDDELNKAEDLIEGTPRERVKVPKKKEKEENEEDFIK